MTEELERLVAKISALYDNEDILNDLASSRGKNVIVDKDCNTRALRVRDPTITSADGRAYYIAGDVYLISVTEFTRKIMSIFPDSVQVSKEEMYSKLFHLNIDENHEKVALVQLEVLLRQNNFTDVEVVERGIFKQHSRMHLMDVARELRDLFLVVREYDIGDFVVLQSLIPLRLVSGYEIDGTYYGERVLRSLRLPVQITGYEMEFTLTSNDHAKVSNNSGRIRRHHDGIFTVRDPNVFLRGLEENVEFSFDCKGCQSALRLSKIDRRYNEILPYLSGVAGGLMAFGVFQFAYKYGNLLGVAQDEIGLARFISFILGGIAGYISLKEYIERELKLEMRDIKDIKHVKHPYRFPIKGESLLNLGFFGDLKDLRESENEDGGENFKDRNIDKLLGEDPDLGVVNT